MSRVRTQGRLTNDCQNTLVTSLTLLDLMFGNKIDPIANSLVFSKFRCSSVHAWWLAWSVRTHDVFQRRKRLARPFVLSNSLHVTIYNSYYNWSKLFIGHRRLLSIFQMTLHLCVSCLLLTNEFLILLSIVSVSFRLNEKLILGTACHFGHKYPLRFANKIAVMLFKLFARRKRNTIWFTTRKQRKLNYLNWTERKCKTLRMIILINHSKLTIGLPRFSYIFAHTIIGILYWYIF